jgi:hypothetical protein
MARTIVTRSLREQKPYNENIEKAVTLLLNGDADTKEWQDNFEMFFEQTRSEQGETEFELNVGSEQLEKVLTRLIYLLNPKPETVAQTIKSVCALRILDNIFQSSIGAYATSALCQDSHFLTTLWEITFANTMDQSADNAECKRIQLALGMWVPLLARPRVAEHLIQQMTEIKLIKYANESDILREQAMKVLSLLSSRLVVGLDFVDILFDMSERFSKENNVLIMQIMSNLASKNAEVMSQHSKLPNYIITGIEAKNLEALALARNITINTNILQNGQYRPKIISALVGCIMDREISGRNLFFLYLVTRQFQVNDGIINAIHKILILLSSKVVRRIGKNSPLRVLPNDVFIELMPFLT